MENIRPWCISRQLWWGHQIPVWYRGDETYVGMDAPNGRRLGARPRRPGHVVLQRACGRSRRSAGRTRRRRAEGLLPDQRAADGARHPVPVGRPHGDAWGSSSRTTSRSTTSTCTRSSRRRTAAACPSRSAPASTRSMLIEGGPRPPVFTEGGEFPAYGADAVRFGLLAMSSTQDVRFNEEQDRPGPPAREQAAGTPRGSCCCACRGRDGPGRRAGAGHGRGPLDPVAAAGGQGRRRASDRGLRVPPRGARRSTTSSTASCATGTSSWSSRGCTTRTRRHGGVRAARAGGDAGARASGDPVRHRGDLVATCPAPTGC